MLEFDCGTGKDKNFVLRESGFAIETVMKYESIFCQGNGYMCVRASTEEDYERTFRGCLVAGTFNLPSDGCPELANCADVVRVLITLDGEPLDITKGTVENYSRELNLRTGLLTRSFTWTAENGAKADFRFERIVSLADFHVISSKISVRAYNDAAVSVRSGIDGQNMPQTEHFNAIETSRSGSVVSLAAKTSESGILFLTSARQKLYVDDVLVSEFPVSETTSPKSVYMSASVDLKAGQTLCFYKVASVFTNRDRDIDGCSLQTLREVAGAHMLRYENVSFEQIAGASAKRWRERIWNERDIRVSGPDFDQLSLRFAVYHLTVMSPTHDNRMNIGAKGLSGPGYKGHSFWDTEIYMLPYFIFAAPNEARSLLEHRYNGLAAAKKNAASRGFEGAMFPWESAWLTDGEVTPSFARTGLLEHHITADVAFGVNSYYIATGDLDFMENYGYELLFETAAFWASRATFNEEKDRYEILQVIGPDEYKEDVDNNAFTNYLAWLNMNLAVSAYDRIKKDNVHVYERLNEKCGLDALIEKVRDRSEKIYLPKPNADGLVPQDDTYLTLRDVALGDKSISEDGGVARQLAGEYGYDVTQVSKQADIMVLFLLLEDLFSYDVKRKNFYYYEKRCFHDSSLSLSTYAVLAADIGEKDQAYRLYGRASRLDLSQENFCSDAGVHSASLGGIWQCVAMGFGGVRIYGEHLRVQPHLPEEWENVRFRVFWHGQKLEFMIDKNKIYVRNDTLTEKVEIMCDGKIYSLDEELVIEYKGLK